MGTPLHAQAWVAPARCRPPHPDSYVETAPTRIARQGNTVKVPALAVPQLAPCASSGRTWRSRAARRSQSEARQLGPQPRPQVLELAAHEGADLTAFDRPGKAISIAVKAWRLLHVPQYAAAKKSVIMRRLCVYWPDDTQWYCGVINDYDPKDDKHLVHYDDDKDEWQHGQSAPLAAPQPGSCASPARAWVALGGSALPGRGPGH